MGRRTLAAILVVFLVGGCVRLPGTAESANVPAPADGDITNATPLAAVIKARNIQPLDPASHTPLLDQAMAELAKTDTDEDERYRGATYDSWKDNVLDPHGRIKSPNAWARSPARLAFMPLDCKAHSEPDFH